MEWKRGTKTRELLESIPEGRENAVDSLYLSALFGQDVTPHLSNLYKQGKVLREKRDNLYRYWKEPREEQMSCRPLKVLGAVFEVPEVGRMIAWNGFTCLRPDPERPDRYCEATVIVAWGFSASRC